ncbi:uncharacterized protein STEHIDRAFT_148816 [Stereum hirsutum FP-91666 SS1]|uniref:uncharacterized protein n=1 Tax=Stereum hirsutum (strain FP-91666) TaxID=721885 RepID=UPI00044494C2|nr:uncharacterized protein STEHIDRAFT_148816 [Stereum hirsutum FP-91666 SS1]EIM83213.1 hypothetical protein STEHIDRAFT_148816 [Stereum hirsutum FP-91666 SS1]
MSSPPPPYSSSEKEADPYYLHTSQKSQTSKLVSRIEKSSTIPIDHVPPQLERATMRLEFPPSYVVVGAYRLISDGSLRGPIWNKCKHGVVRGGAVGLGWALFTFKIQRKFVKLFMSNSSRFAGLSDDTLFGYKLPFDVTTYSTLVLLSTQLTFILTFFLSRNLRIARERAWNQTVASRGKGAEFWKPYVEEWEVPPKVNVGKWAGLEGAKGWVLGYAVKQVILFPLHAVPLVGIFIRAGFKALDTARYLHRPYFAAKNMTREQIAVFVAEHQYDYYAFGFAAAVMEAIPFIGLIFSVSNRIGAAMWAHDLEKKQHWVAEERAKKGQ